jgi:hypothetical protein
MQEYIQQTLPILEKLDVVGSPAPPEQKTTLGKLSIEEENYYSGQRSSLQAREILADAGRSSRRTAGFLRV